MAGSRDKLPFTQGEIAKLAETMGYFEKRYTDLAKAMDTAKIPAITAGNIKLLRRGLSHVEKAVNAAYSAYDKELIRLGTKDELTPAELAKSKRLAKRAARHAEDKPTKT